MRRNSGELQNFISDKIQIWARVVLKMLLTGIKVQKWSKVAQKRPRNVLVTAKNHILVCFTDLSVLPPFLRPKKGPVWPIDLPYWPHSTKLSRTYRVTYQNLCEKGTKPMGKVLDQSIIPDLRKIPKTTLNQKSDISGSSVFETHRSLGLPMLPK